MSDSAVRVLMLARMLAPAYRTAYGLGVSEIAPAHRFIVDGLVRDGLAVRRSPVVFDGRVVREECWLVTPAGAEVLRAALERAR